MKKVDDTKIMKQLYKDWLLLILVLIFTAPFVILLFFITFLIFMLDEILIKLKK